MSGVNDDTPAVHKAFRNDNRPVNGDFLFEGLSNAIIVPGLDSTYEPYVVRITWQTLKKNNVIAIFVDPLDQCQFDSFTLVGIAVVVEASPVILTTFLMEVNDVRKKIPKNLTLFATGAVFAFNSFGLGALAEIFGDRLPPNVEGVQGPMVQHVHGISNSGATGNMQGYPPSTVTPSENTYKARKNADEIQPIKVLFRHDTACFLNFCGPLEDLASDRVVAYVHGRVPESFLKLIALQGPNIHMLMRLRFQMVPDIGSEAGKASKSLNLSQFRIPGAVISNFYHVKGMFEKFVETICAIVPNDDGFMDEIFADTLKLLNSSEERSLRNLNHTLLLRELNQRLIDFGMVLAGSTALTDSEKMLAIQLREALYIDYNALFLKNLHKEHESMKRLTAAASRVSHKRSSDYGGGQGGDGKRLNLDNTQKPGRGLCISQACYVYLGAGKVFDREKKININS